MKIHIIGGPGSGKTTLGRKIAERLRAPFYDLDQAQLDEENGVELAAGEAWVMEGIYLVVTEPMLYAADMIVVLEVAWPVAAWRMLYRHFYNSWRGQQRYPGLNGLRLLFKLLKHSREYYLNVGGAYEEKVAEMRAYIAQHGERTEPPTREFMRGYVERYKDVIAPPTEAFARKYLERYGEKVVFVRSAEDRKRLFDRVGV